MNGRQTMPRYLQRGCPCDEEGGHPEALLLHQLEQIHRRHLEDDGWTRTATTIDREEDGPCLPLRRGPGFCTLGFLFSSGSRNCRISNSHSLDEIVKGIYLVQIQNFFYFYIFFSSIYQKYMWLFFFSKMSPCRRVVWR